MCNILVTQLGGERGIRMSSNQRYKDLQSNVIRLRGSGDVNISEKSIM